MISSILRASLLFVFLLAFGKNAEATTAAFPPKKAEWHTGYFSKKEKRKIRRWQKRTAKLRKAASENKPKNKCGKLAWFAIILGFVLGFLMPAFFVLGFLLGLVFSLLGIFHDQRKDTAVAALIWLATILSLAILVLIGLRNAID